MKRQLKFLLFSSLSLAACNKNDDTAPPQQVAKGVILTTNATYGPILTDSAGNTLYFFSLDANGNSACSGNCVVAWPVYYTPTATADAGLNKADFATIVRSDGTPQTTYKGWPLYYYQIDAKPGDVNGENVNNVWFVAKPNYTLMLANNQLVGNDGKQYKSDYTEGTGLTQYFTDGMGRTVYAFTPDKFNQNNYTKPDFSNNATWPIYETDVNDLPSVVNKDDVGVIDIFGKKQLTYKGWPLYYFGPDAERGDTKGVSVPTPGFWPYVNLQSTPAPEE
jgi:predicted lipoprotein with Yx(FWY)xxD motif